MKLILASTSPYRRALLDRLGLPFECRAPRVNEDDAKSLGLEPRALAEHLAAAKAQSIAAAEPDATVIGSDQLVALGDCSLGKPGTPEQAVAMLIEMAGRSHDLITAMAIAHEGRLIAHTDVTRLHMRQLDRAALERYVAADVPLDCAGAYKLESRGIALFEKIESADHTAITGLPLIALVTILRELGYQVP